MKVFLLSLLVLGILAGGYGIIKYINTARCWSTHVQIQCTMCEKETTFSHLRSGVYVCLECGYEVVTLLGIKKVTWKKEVKSK